jgi:hypothetical protein
MLFYRSPPRIPQVHLPEEPVLQVASALCVEINGAFVVLRSIAAGKDLKKFLIVCFLNISSLLFLQVHLVIEVDHLIFLPYFVFSRIILILLLHMDLKFIAVEFCIIWSIVSLLVFMLCLLWLIPKIAGVYWCQVIAGLWVMSIVGSWCHFLTLFYICMTFEADFMPDFMQFA